jgi:hypothetical protein
MLSTDSRAWCATLRCGAEVCARAAGAPKSRRRTPRQIRRMNDPPPFWCREADAPRSMQPADRRRDRPSRAPRSLAGFMLTKSASNSAMRSRPLRGAASSSATDSHYNALWLQARHKWRRLELPLRLTNRISDERDRRSLSLERLVASDHLIGIPKGGMSQACRRKRRLQ